MDRVLEACGAPSCITPSRRIVAEEPERHAPEIGLNLIRRLLTEAQRNGAEAIATVFPFASSTWRRSRTRQVLPASFTSRALLTQLLALALAYG